MSALVIRLPRTPEGRAQLFEQIAHGGLHEEYPDGSRLCDVDWDQFAIDIAASIADYERFCEERGL